MKKLSVLDWLREKLDALLFPRPEVRGFVVEIQAPQIEKVDVSVQPVCTEPKEFLFQ